ncbi:MAG: hypothetical protein K2I93_04475 [Oscillospiraceae bacterium]|nr:hypothetical protein [Oscillospiraceae bacterium]
MKRIIAYLLSAAVLLSMSGMAAFAEGAVPANVEPAVYEQLLNSYKCDSNEDGIVTEEEMQNVESLSLRLDGVTDISFLQRMTNLRFLSLRGGEITDVSVLQNLPMLQSLYLDSLPITDISFMKNMQLKTALLYEMPQITTEDKLAVMTWGDYTITKGYSDAIGAFPVSLLDENVELILDDQEIASFDRPDYRKSAYSSFAYVYGKNTGTTRYHVTLDGEEVLSGQITVTDGMTPYSAPLGEKRTDFPEISASNYYGNQLFLMDGTLYAIKDQELIIAEEQVADYYEFFSYQNAEGNYQYTDMVLFEDGSLTIDGKQFMPEESFIGIDYNCCWTEDGRLYRIQDMNQEFIGTLITDDFGYFMEGLNSYYRYVTADNEVVCLKRSLNEDGIYDFTKYYTGVKNVVSGQADYILDEDHILWHIYDDGRAVKWEENVVSVGYYRYDDGSVYGNIYITSDGTAYSTTSRSKVTLCDQSEEAVNFLTTGYLYTEQGVFGGGGSDSLRPDVPGYYHISLDRILYLDYEGKQAVMEGVGTYIGCEYTDNRMMVYFMCVDGSVWKYNFGDDTFTELLPDTSERPDVPVQGDVNDDGIFDLADVVAMQKWVLGAGSLKNWENGDMNKDAVIDVFDLALLKRALLAK